MRPFGFVTRAFSRAMDNYATKYIETSSAVPIYHVCFGGMIFSYFVNHLPHELSHLEHQQHLQRQAAKEQAASSHP